MQKVGRNDPCPCGSGKKYKKCCLANSWSPPGREESIKSRLLEDILAFVKKNLRHTVADAYDYFWDDFDPEEYLDPPTFDLANINMWEWFIHDWRPDEGDKTLIELYMEGTGTLGPEERDLLHRMNDAVISLYEVQDVFPGQGMVLKDLLLGGEHHVREKTATSSLRQWDILATRLIRLDGGIVMSGGIYPYPIEDKKAIIDHLKGSFRNYRKNFPEATMRDFLKRNGDLFNYYWYENIREPFMPVLITSSGEPVVFCKAFFDCVDRQAVSAGLGKMHGFEEVKEGVFRWLDEYKEDGSATILGTVRIKDGSLELECNSVERLERGKTLLLDTFDGLITHRADTLQDPSQALKDLPEILREETREDPDTGVSQELEQEFYELLMRRYYENWLNEKIPVLEGRTPLEAVKRPWGKKKVAELLKSIENSEEHRKRRGEPWFDASWLWERLGLER